MDLLGTSFKAHLGSGASNTWSTAVCRGRSTALDEGIKRNCLSPLPIWCGKHKILHPTSGQSLERQRSTSLSPSVENTQSLGGVSPPCEVVWERGESGKQETERIRCELFEEIKALSIDLSQHGHYIMEQAYRLVALWCWNGEPKSLTKPMPLYCLFNVIFAEALFDQSLPSPTPRLYPVLSELSNLLLEVCQTVLES